MNKKSPQYLLCFDEKKSFSIGITDILSKFAPFAVRGLQVNTGLSFCLEHRTVRNYTGNILPHQGSQYRIYSNRTY